VLKIHAELPLDRITSVLAGWLRRLEPLGHGNPEPVFLARRTRLLSRPRIMKERHIRLELVQTLVQTHAQTAASGAPPEQFSAGSSATVRAVGWNLAARAAELALNQGSLIDIAYRIRENDHPEFGGLEVEIAGIEPSAP
jgi:single-stranded-DNA-specific exonuclease